MRAPQSLSQSQLANALVVLALLLVLRRVSSARTGVPAAATGVYKRGTLEASRDELAVAANDAAAAAPGGKKVRKVGKVDFFRVVLTDLYKKYNPAGVGKIPLLLRKYAGKEQDLVKRVIEKYTVDREDSTEAPTPPAQEDANAAVAAAAAAGTAATAAAAVESPSGASTGVSSKSPAADAAATGAEPWVQPQAAAAATASAATPSASASRELGVVRRAQFSKQDISQLLELERAVWDDAHQYPHLSNETRNFGEQSWKLSTGHLVTYVHAHVASSAPARVHTRGCRFKVWNHGFAFLDM